jgi:hypothetical protein
MLFVSLFADFGGALGGALQGAIIGAALGVLVAVAMLAIRFFQGRPSGEVKNEDEILDAFPDDAPDLAPIEACFSPPMFVVERPWVGFVCGPLLLAIPALVTVGILQTDEPIPLGAKIALGIFGGVMGLGGVFIIGRSFYMLGKPRYSFGTHWLLFQDDFAVLRKGKLTVIPWDDFRIRKTRYHPIGSHYVVTGTDGEPVPLPYASKKFLPKGMARSFQERMSELRVPRLLRAVERGKAVRFGPLAVTQDALVFRKKPIPWADIDKLDFTATQGTWVIDLTALARGTRAPLFEVSVSESMPNVGLLVDLVRKLQPQVIVKGKKLENVREWIL